MADRLAEDGRSPDDASRLTALLQLTPVVPVVVIDDASRAVPVARALVAGGLPIMEITLRTSTAIEAIGGVAADVPEAHVGAGTVLSNEQAAKAVSAGARFIVSPGLDEDVVSVAGELSVPVMPGVTTPSEVQRAWNLGLRALKYFPASLAGGIPMLKALGAVFRDVRFIPTGGISAANLCEYLEVPSVIACGGSWLTPPDAIAGGDYAVITRLATEAVAIAGRAMGQPTTTANQAGG
ncbi:MAG: bifunctional 4-hydroxy-2-oxoglutarate aldolase/2-dehydro-3-deoxy-phosphogluconate aldolase [Proteobacteria bacterium]|nr:bifunctional 4-hydroxy-2-oxoglutarate aldolase/2-dehydro-3-deoxy-phosphogluconate aldolase [Pseudomonadota bacterium]MYJ94414.1 bifunctional 4-hydroxy-2-oxoglutarate aldolase/2-dehydro-3-deoxy-phosphogluconate aldolase [Pseudomonadota bacterium]